MIGHADVLCDLQQGAHLAHELGSEPWISIQNDVLWVTEVGEHMLHI